jgi:RNA-directed DNA polymerase
MSLWPPAHYLQFAQQRDTPDAVAREALRQANELQRNRLPAILTLKHLAIHTSTRYEDLRRYVEREQDPYRTFRISKRSGGKRQICVPSPPLMIVQRWLAAHVLRPIPPDTASTAYSQGSSPVRCAWQHCGARWLLKLDIRKFFESVSEIQVFHVFESLGYNPLISFEMARLCTRIYSRSNRWMRSVWTVWSQDYEAIPAYQVKQIGHLPQGAPTSPMLSNLAMRELDSDLARLAASAGLIYTRYADDLAFSTGSSAFSRGDATAFLHLVQKRVRAEGLSPNKRKTLVAPPGARKIVLGLLVDGDRPRLRREFRERLLVHAHYLKRFGPAHHAEKRGFRSVWSMHRHIYGLVGYARQVEPAFAQRVEEELASVRWGPLAHWG